MLPLRCACLVDRRDDALLLVRVRDNERWYLAGGKIEQDETPEATLCRELHEELGVELVQGSVRYLYTVVGPAYGRSGEVELVCFEAEWLGEVRPRGDVSEARWLDFSEMAMFAPAVQKLCREHLVPNRANKALEPTRPSVTDRAAARSAP